VTRWFRDLEQGSPEAAQRLWERYSRRLIELARRKLRNATRIADEEDVAITVFECICRAAAEGRFSNLQNRDELWWLLVMVTKQKALDQMRREGRQKRGGGRVVRETDIAGNSTSFSLDQVLGADPTPEFLAIMDEEQRRLLGLLRDDQLRTIAVRRIQGYTYDEISSQLDISSRTVIRKLNLVRMRWEYELQRDLD
jgi:RNA polymerase sigma factor (sigma-70 family)